MYVDILKGVVEHAKILAKYVFLFLFKSLSDHSAQK